MRACSFLMSIRKSMVFFNSSMVIRVGVLVHGDDRPQVMMRPGHVIHIATLPFIVVLERVLHEVGFAVAAGSGPWRAFPR